MKFTSVIAITAVSVIAMINIRDFVNHSEAMRAMEHLSRIITQYRKENGSVPSESYINGIKEKLYGYPRLRQLYYRALWIDIESPPDEILAYARQNYHSWFLKSGFIVIRLDGRVEWMNNEEFEKIITKRQSPAEIRTIRPL